MLGLLTMVHPSSIYPSVTFHISNISIRIVSIMAAMAVILKVFNCYLLPNRKSDRLKAWLKALGQHGDLELKWFCSDIKWPPWQPSSKSSNHICSRTVCLIELKLN